MWPKNLGLDVSRESLEKLELYQALLFKWQKAINLVSPKTLQESSVRHFADSAQLEQYIPSHVKTVMDWGSGAGFPGVVLAILRPDIKFFCVESDERKCQFLRTVSRETNATIRIENRRIEDFVAGLCDVPDLVTARALKSVKELLDFGRPALERRADLQFLLLKGARVDEEFADARGYYSFDVERYPSCTSDDGVIVHIKNISIL